MKGYIGIDNTYAINLPKDTKRLSELIESTKKINISPTIITGVNGRDIPDELQIYTNLKDKFLSRSALGCGLAHIRMWKKMIENDDQVALFLEDDSEPINNFNEIFGNIWESVPKDFDFVYLSCHDCSTKKKYNIEFSMINLLRSKYRRKVVTINENVYIASLPMGLTSYVLSRKCAENLLEYFENVKLSSHIDFQLLHALKDSTVYAINPNLFHQRDIDIGTSNNIKQMYPSTLNDLVDNLIPNDSDGIPISYKLTVPSHVIYNIPINAWILVFVLFACIFHKVNIDTISLFFIGFSIIEIIYSKELNISQSCFTYLIIILIVSLFSFFD